MVNGRLTLMHAAMHAFVEASADQALLIDVVRRRTGETLACVCSFTLRDRDEASTEEPAEQPRTLTALDVPVPGRVRALGSLLLSRDRGAPAFDDDDVRIAETLARHAGVVLEQCLSFGAARRELATRQHSEARLRLLSEVAREFSEATRDYRGLLDLVARKLSEMVGDLCCVRMLDKDGASLETGGAVHHRDPDMVAAAREILVSWPVQRGDDTLAGRILESGEPQILSQLEPDMFAAILEPQYRRFVERLDARSVVVVPLLFEGRPFGVVTMVRHDPGRPYTDDDLCLLRDLAVHASLAINNSRYFDASHRLSARLCLLSELTREFSQVTSDYRALIELIAQRVGEVVGEACLIHIVAPESDLLTTVDGMYHPDPRVREELRDWLFKHPQRIDEGLSGRALASDAAILIAATAIDEVARHTHRDRYLVERLGARSVMAVPLRRDGRAIGVAMMTRSDANDPYTGADKALLDEVALHASIAITNAQLFASVQRELRERERAEAALGETEEQLRQSQKMDAIGRLAGGVAHDFNNLLSVILSYVSLLIEEVPEDAPMRLDLEEIRKASQRAADLTRQLLAFSRHQVVQPRIVDLNQIIDGMAEMNRRLVGEDIEYRTLTSPELGRIKADPGHLQQVIMNLVVNARDAMPTGGRLTVRTSNVDLDNAYASQHVGVTPGPHVMLAVSDTGMGIDKATQLRIFEPFFTTKDTGKGTGLGLSTVFGIVRQSNGSVWVLSEPGHGTTFEIYFPQTDEAEPHLAGDVAVRSLRGSETILLVEDEDQLRTVVVGILTRAGYHVVEARNGAEALASCHRHAQDIQLLLTDVVMPQMSGREVAEHVQRLRPDTKVLYMSGYTNDAMVQHGVLVPGITLLQKPITPAGLLHKVREVLNEPARCRA